MSDKNQAVINYILQCPQIQNTPLYFNFINAKDNTVQILTSSNDRYTEKPDITGAVEKQYTFIIMVFKSITSDAIVNLDGFSHENVEELSYIQELIDWIAEQNDLQNYPDFGELCVVDTIRTSEETPKLEAINTQVSPALAMYSVTIQITYIDNSKKLWR